MQERKYIKTTWLSKKAALFSIFCMVCCFFSCRQKPGDPEKFTTISYDQLTEKNSPAGIVLHAGKVRLMDGFGLEHSPDSTMAMLVNPGKKGGGTTAIRCDCDGLIKLGCIVVLDGIITCKPLLCTSCKPVLQIYDGFVSVEKFRGAMEKRN